MGHDRRRRGARREHFQFYDLDASRNEVRWMCSFDTKEQDIDDFVAALTRELVR